MKRSLSLRGSLRLLGLGVIAYVAIIAVAIAFRLGPTAVSLRRYSEAMLRGYNGMRVRTLAYHQTIDDIHPLLIAIARGATPEAARPRLEALRARVDSLAAASSPPVIATIPADMRFEFASGSAVQSGLESALSDALANLELGRAGVATRRLEAADSLAGLLDKHVSEAQRLGLVDLIRRESALADATTASLRAIGWWVGLGILVAPFFITYFRRRFYDPITELDRALVRVARGDLEGMIPVLRQDELGRLSGHFNETTAMLRRRAEETRRHAQAALRESEERYQAIVEFAPLGIAVVDAQGHYVHANPALVRFLGYSEGELRTMRFNDVTHPADIALTTEPFREMVSGARDRFHVEKRYVRKDGTVVWGRLMVAAVRDDTGKLVHTVSLTEDVTDERRRDAAAHQVEERLRREQAALVALARHQAFTTGDVRAAWQELTETAARTLEVERVGIWRLDVERSSLRCDDLYHLSRDRHSDGVALAVDRIPTYFRALDAHRVIAAPDARNEPRIGELNGVYLAPLSITSLLAAPIRVGGRVAGVVALEHVGPPREWSAAAQSFAASLADLAALALEGAERARTGIALHKSEEKFATAFRLSPNPSVIARVDDGTLVDVNDAYLEVTGFTREDVLGTSAAETLWPVPEGRAEMVRELKQRGRLRHLDLKMRTKAGPLLDVLVSVEVIEIDGVPHTLGSAIDITERNRVAEALRDSEERFRRLVQDLSVGVGLLDGAGRVLLCNPAGLKWLGVTAEELGQDGFWQRELIAMREDGTPFPAHERPVLQAVRTGQAMHDQVLGYRPRGQSDMRWANFNVDPQKDATGTVRNVIVSFSDVTESKRAAEALRESEERYRTLVETSPDGVSVIEDGRIRYANPAGLLLVGARELSEVVGRLAVDFIGEESLADATRRIAAVSEGHRDTVGEVKLRRVDGSEVDIEAIGIRMPYEGRTAVLVIHRDITERKRAERQLQLLAQAVKSTSEAITITDLEGYFTFVNRAFLEQIGYTEEEVLGRHVKLIDSPRNPPGLQAELIAATTRGGWSGELYNRRKDGTDFVMTLTTAQVKDAEGRIIALMGVSSDITERKLAEEEAVRLQESLRRAETMSALGAVVAGVAHEVRNPLFALSATVDALEARFGPQPAYARYAETLRQEVSRLSRLMSDLLDYGKPPRLDLSDAPIGPVVSGAIAACAALAEQAGVRLVAEVGDDLPLLPLDPARMLQVLQNLIDNAIQHSPEGGHVVVRAATVLAPNASGIELSVADQGPGIRPEDIANIFEPFFTRRRGGTGLGLSIVQRIVEQHGGEVTAENRKNGGALITLRLCRAVAATV
ncbi:MAG TPA: PAS domain S-box protein [Gemmatimonadales bacterium]|nr:PAS domain S-box protein [Gemmatimonadales bacterium]